jgi:hypothetical protein
MANAGVETGANMFGVCTVTSVSSGTTPPTLVAMSMRRLTIMATARVRTAAPTPQRGGRSTVLQDPSSTDLVALLTYPSFRFPIRSRLQRLTAGRRRLVERDDDGQSRQDQRNHRRKTEECIQAQPGVVLQRTDAKRRDAVPQMMS